MAEKEPKPWQVLEAVVAMYCNAYENQRVACIEKVDPPSVTTVLKGGFTRTSLKPSPFLDFVGVWTERGNMAIHIECKATEEPRLRMDEKGLSDSQWIQMLRWERAGAAVCLLWMYQGDIKLLTTAAIRQARIMGNKSVRWEAGFDLPYQSDVIQHDFLKVLAQIQGHP